MKMRGDNSGIEKKPYTEITVNSHHLREDQFFLIISKKIDRILNLPLPVARFV